MYMHILITIPSVFYLFRFFKKGFGKVFNADQLCQNQYSAIKECITTYCNFTSSSKLKFEMLLTEEDTREFPI